jgi:hypothetical protein
MELRDLFHAVYNGQGYTKGCGFLEIGDGLTRLGVDDVFGGSGTCCLDVMHLADGGTVKLDAGGREPPEELWVVVGLHGVVRLDGRQVGAP